MADYNQIFEKITEKSDDGLIGMVAYSLYKTNKRQWILDYIEEHNSAPDKDARAIYELAQTSNQIDMYLTEAGNLLGEFYSEILQENLPEIKEEIEANGITSILDSGLKEVRASIKPTLKYEISIAILGAFSYSMVLLVFYLVIRLLGFDFADILMIQNPPT